MHRRALTFPCRRCGGDIRWRRLPSGKFAPQNADDGDLHWERCKAAQRRREGPDVGHEARLDCPKCGGPVAEGECSHCGPMSDAPAHEQKPTTCRKCGGAIRFRRLPNGKLAPINDNDGEFHRQSCKVALWHRKGEPDVSPPFVTSGIGARLYQGRRPPWSYSSWRWVDPGDEAKKRRWLSRGWDGSAMIGNRPRSSVPWQGCSQRGRTQHENMTILRSKSDSGVPSLW